MRSRQDAHQEMRKEGMTKGGRTERGERGEGLYYPMMRVLNVPDSGGVVGVKKKRGEKPRFVIYTAEERRRKRVDWSLEKDEVKVYKET